MPIPNHVQSWIRSEYFHRRHVADAHEHGIRFRAIIRARPRPDRGARAAMRDRFIHAQPRRHRVFVRDNKVHVIDAAKAVVHRREQAVCVGRQINAYDIGFFVEQRIDEPWALMAEAVVLLPPERGSLKIRERPPWELATHFEKFRELIHHRSDDGEKALVAWEKTMPAGEQIALQPCLAGVLGKNFEHASTARANVLGAIVAFNGPLVVTLCGRVKNAAELVAHQFVGGEYAEVARILHDDFGEIFCEDIDRSFFRLATFLSVNFDRALRQRRTVKRRAKPASQRVRIAAHPPLVPWTTGENVRLRCAVFIEEFLGVDTKGSQSSTSRRCSAFFFTSPTGT
jgi:hypothetical protein